MNCEELSKYTFKLYNHQIKYLDSVNSNNRSGALRDVIDDTINNNDKLKRKLAIDRVIQYGMYSAIFLLLSYLLVFPLNVASIGFGTFILTYGMIGGIQFALSRTNGN